MIKVTDQPPGGLAGKPLAAVRQLLCASPTYLREHGTPQHPQALLRHSCLFLGERPGDDRWHFSNGAQQEVVTVRGRYISNHSEARLEAALADLGITVLPHFTAEGHWPRGVWSKSWRPGATPARTRALPGCCGGRTCICHRNSGYSSTI